jgi:low affinity Fe/Cu permease
LFRGPPVLSFALFAIEFQGTGAQAGLCRPLFEKGIFMDIREAFRKFAMWTAELMGSAYAFFFALITIVVWAALGPLYRFSDTWQLVINTGTTIITFLMVFLLQSTQNRDTLSLQLKLDELIRAVKNARNELIDLEDLSEKDLGRLKKEFAEQQKMSECSQK